jgi:Xaa-Pro aminopeptidase
LPDVAAYRARIERLRAAIHREGLDALLVTNASDVAYLTGFLGGDSYLVVEGPAGAAQPTILSDFRYQDELEPVKALVRVVIRTRAITEAVIDLISSLRLGRVGVQGEHITFAEYGALATSLGPHRVAPTVHVVGRLREVKDQTEVALIRAAVRIQEEALRAVLPRLRPGVTELEVAARLEAEMKLRGASAPSFQTIVAARANGSLPHHRPGAVVLAANQPVLIDWGATRMGYRGDMTRTLTLGRWPVKIKEIYKIVLDAHLLAAAALAPGKSTHEIDAVARDHIARAGHGPRFGHGLGHGIGLNGHEDPRLNRMSPPATLQPGHVVTIEPGIYLPGVGGVRIEDDYVVTPRGADNLCSLPKDLAWATLD